MFYRIRNHTIDLDRVIDIHIEDDFIIFDMDNGTNYSISLEDIDSDKLMDEIQLDVHIF